MSSGAGSAGAFPGPGGLSAADTQLMNTGVSPSQPSGFMSFIKGLGGMGQGSPSGTTGAVEGGINTGLKVGSLIPGPQQPFVAAASAIAPMVESMIPGGGGSKPMQLPSLPQAPQIQRGSITPVNAAPPRPPQQIGNLGTGGASFADLLKLITSMKGN